MTNVLRHFSSLKGFVLTMQVFVAKARCMSCACHCEIMAKANKDYVEKSSVAWVFFTKAPQWAPCVLEKYNICDISRLR